MTNLLRNRKIMVNNIPTIKLLMYRMIGPNHFPPILIFIGFSAYRSQLERENRTFSERNRSTVLQQHEQKRLLTCNPLVAKFELIREIICRELTVLTYEKIQKDKTEKTMV